jgi:serine/threonine-protein kinase
MDDLVAQLQAGQILGKDFRVLRPLAAGGMGAVYLVEQLSTGRERALKIMHPQFVKSADSRARFTQEAKVGAKIRSDHVVEVVSAGVDDDTGIPWLAMELLDGEELAKRIQRKGFLPPAEVLEIFRQLCHALGEAHKNGLVHRDLKPQNIFMAHSRRQGEAFTVKILDFGVAKLVQEQQGEGDMTKPVGTPRWMAPEQSDQGAAIRPATDIWALGLIAFNCLTGKYFWKTANAQQANLTALLRELIVEPIVPASQRAAELACPGAMPRGFDDWFRFCVERDVNRRFQNATAALEALVPVLERAPAWKPASVSQVIPDDSATTPGPVALQHTTPEIPHHTPQPPGDDSDTLRWGRLSLKPTKEATPPSSIGTTSTRPFASPPPSQQPTEQLPERSRLPLIAGIAVGIAALGAAAFVALRASKPAPPPPAPVAQQPAPAPLPEAFTVVFDSFPSGAAVMEGDARLGTTPMQLSLRNAGLEKEPRKFSLVREGFLSYAVVQGPSREPVRVLATLAADPGAATRKPPPEKRRRSAEPEAEPELRTRR